MAAFEARLEPVRVGCIAGLYSHDMTLSLATSLILWWKGISVANTLAYYDTASMTIIKNLVLQVIVWKGNGWN